MKILGLESVIQYSNPNYWICTHNYIRTPYLLFCGKRLAARKELTTLSWSFNKCVNLNLSALGRSTVILRAKVVTVPRTRRLNPISASLCLWKRQGMCSATGRILTYHSKYSQTDARWFLGLSVC